MEKFRGAAEVVAEKTFTVNGLHAANSSLLNLLFTLVTALVIWYGGSKIIDGYDPVTGLWAGMTPGELTQFVLYLGLLVFPIRMSGWGGQQLLQGVVCRRARLPGTGCQLAREREARGPFPRPGGRAGEVWLGGL